MTDLARVPGVALIDRDRVEEPRAAHLVAPDADDAGDARALEVATQPGGAHERAVEGLLVRRHVRWRREDDRILAVVDRLDRHDRLLALTGRVVAGPLAERTLVHLVGAVGESLHHDLGVGRDRETCDGSL